MGTICTQKKFERVRFYGGKWMEELGEKIDKVSNHLTDLNRNGDSKLLCSS